VFSHIPILLNRPQPVVSARATAILRPDTALLKAAGGLSENNHECDLTTGYPVLLTITKECKERKYRGVAIRQPAPLARVHAASDSGC